MNTFYTLVIFVRSHCPLHSACNIYQLKSLLMFVRLAKLAKKRKSFDLNRTIKLAELIGKYFLSPALKCRRVEVFFLIVKRLGTVRMSSEERLLDSTCFSILIYQP